MESPKIPGISVIVLCLWHLMFLLLLHPLNYRMMLQWDTQKAFSVAEGDNTII